MSVLHVQERRGLWIGLCICAVGTADRRDRRGGGRDVICDGEQILPRELAFRPVARGAALEDAFRMQPSSGITR